MSCLRRCRALPRPSAVRRRTEARLTIFALLSGLNGAACEARYVNLGNAPPASGGAGATSGGNGNASGAAAAGAGGTSGGAGTAGTAGARGRLRFDNHAVVAELIPDDATDVKQDNPTLNDEMTELYFTSNREGGAGEADVWVSRRASPLETWGEPEPLVGVNTDRDESSPAIASDGSKLWVGIDSDDGRELEIWEFSRGSSALEWRDGRNVTALNSAQSDIPRPPGFGGLIMPMASRRSNNGRYWTYFARRASLNDDFGTPELLAVLNTTEDDTVDGFLTQDGLRFFYNAERREGRGDLWVAYRASPNIDFSGAHVEELSDINTDGDQRDPWLSPDGKTLYYSSDADGFLTIWQSRVLPPDD